MAEIDYLNQRTTNINIRISPMLKTQLIDSGARQGLNLSDYIMHLLLTEMSGGNEIDITLNEEYQDLWKENQDNEEEVETLKAEKATAAETFKKEKAQLLQQLKGYDELTNDFQDYIGQTIVLNNEKTEIKSPLDILKTIVKCVKFKNI
jgi:hypothetical protein